MPEPDFEQIALEIRDYGDGTNTAYIEERLRQVWNAGKESVAEDNGLLTKHLKDEHAEAHVALDRCNVPYTKQVPRRDGAGKQDITLGLAERIDMMRRQVWNARGAADLEAVDRCDDEIALADRGSQAQDAIERAIRRLDR